jgi:hypothetical protein
MFLISQSRPKKIYEMAPTLLSLIFSLLHFHLGCDRVIDEWTNESSWYIVLSIRLIMEQRSDVIIVCTTFVTL